CLMNLSQVLPKGFSFIIPSKPTHQGIHLFDPSQCFFHLGEIHTAVHRIMGWQNSNENQHDQSDALLAVVRAVSKADAGASQQQNCANPKRWWFVCLRFLIKTTISDKRLTQKQQPTCQTETDQR